jgi:hypothetical protein
MLGRGQMKLVVAAIMFLSVMVPFAAPARSGSEDYETRTSAEAPFVFIYPPRLSRMADTVEEILVRTYEEIARAVGLEQLDTVTVYIAGDEETYRRLHGGLVPEWGIAYSRRDGREIGIDAGAVLRTPQPLETVIRHELSHIALTERVGGAACPRWFAEGLAMIQSREWGFEDQWGLMSSVWKKSLPSIEDLEGSFPHGAEDATLAYRVSYYAVDELLRRRPEDLVTLTSFIRDLGDFDRAFLLTFGESPVHYSDRIYVQIVDRYATAAMLMRSMPYWGILSVLVILAYLFKRLRARRKLKEWESQEDGTASLF